MAAFMATRILDNARVSAENLMSRDERLPGVFAIASGEGILMPDLARAIWAD